MLSLSSFWDTKAQAVYEIILQISFYRKQMLWTFIVTFQPVY